MPIIKHRIIAEIDPSHPVQEICAIISSVVQHHPAADESNILIGVQEAVTKRLKELKQKGDLQHEPIHKPERKQKDI